MPEGPTKTLTAVAQDALLAAFPTYAALDTFVIRYLDGVDLAAVVPVGETYAYIVLRFVQWCRSGAGGDGRFLQVVRLLYQMHAHLPKVRELYESVFPDAPPAAGPAGHAQRGAHLPCCLGTSTVFLDRENLHRAVVDCETQGGSNVLVVKGGRGSGKSFSFLLIKHLARDYGYRLVWLDLREELTPGAGPDVLVRAMLYQMGIDARGLPAQGQYTGERWAQELSNWLVGVLQPQPQQAATKWWIVVDGFGSCFVPAEVRALLSRLAGRVANVLPNIRLALLGYDDVFTGPLAHAVRVEDIGPIGRTELARFFRQAFALHGQPVDEQNPVDDPVLDEAVEQVLDAFRQVPQDHPEALRILHDLARDAVHDLFFERGGES